MSKLSLRSGRKKFQPRCRWRISECALYWVATAEAADAGVQRVGQREVDDAGLAAEIDRRLGAPVGQFLEAAAAPAGQHISHGVARQRLVSLEFHHLVLPNLFVRRRNSSMIVESGSSSHRRFPSPIYRAPRLGRSAVALSPSRHSRRRRCS